jgi:hypothetical protein
VAGVAASNGFTVPGTGDLGQPLNQAYYVAVDLDQPLAVNNGGPNLSPGFVGQAYTAYFFVIGGAALYTWSLVSGQFPPGLSHTTFSDPRDANDELVGTPTTTGTVQPVPNKSHVLSSPARRAERVLPRWAQRRAARCRRPLVQLR